MRQFLMETILINLFAMALTLLLLSNSFCHFSHRYRTPLLYQHLGSEMVLACNGVIAVCRRVSVRILSGCPVVFIPSHAGIKRQTWETGQKD